MVLASPDSGGGNAAEIEDKPSSGETPEESATRKLAESQETQVSEQEQRVETSEGQAPQGTNTGTESASLTKRARNLKASTIWIGSSSTGDDESEISSAMDELEEQDLLKRDGIAIVYNPLIPNDNAVPDFDPMDISTFALSMTEDETSKLLSVAEVRASKFPAHFVL